MTKEELEKEAEEWVISNTEIYDDKFGIECEVNPQAEEAYVAGAEPREKRVAELEAQIEKMKCCGNCAKNGHICVAEEMQGNLCGKNKDKWEIKEK